MSRVLVRKFRAALDVVRAIRVVSHARRTVAVRPIGALISRDESLRVPPGISPDRQLILLPLAESRRGDRWGSAVDRALRWLPGDSACLVRATALRDLLVADGARGAVVRIGVRRGGAGFEAHAWVELDGTPIAEPVALRGAFSSLEGVTLR